METSYASFGRRLAATLADGFVLAIINFLFGFVLGFFLPDLKNLKDVLVMLVVSVITYLVLTTVYYLICWLKFDGATIGKKLAAIKIVKIDGSPLTFGTAVLRIIGYWISTIVFGLGYLWVLWDKNKQGWHDKIAKTYVVNTGAKQRKVLLGIFIIGFILFSLLGNFQKNDVKKDITFINEDGSIIKNESETEKNINESATTTVLPKNNQQESLKNKIIAEKIFEDEGMLKSWEYIGQTFDFYEKANLNIDIETNGDLGACIFTESEFLKYQKEEKGAKCLYEVTSIPAIVSLEKGRYTFVLEAKNSDVNYKVSLNATK